MPQFKDIKGLRFGRLVPIERTADAVFPSGRRTTWLCLCDCGSQVVISRSALVSGRTRSCGCFSREVHKSLALPPGEASCKSLYHKYKVRANGSGLSFELSFEQFKSITSSCCFYCGEAPSRKHQARTSPTPYVFNGIDRKNNSEGYTANNSVPCCWPCNRIKRDIDFPQFVSWVRKVASRLS